MDETNFNRDSAAARVILHGVPSGAFVMEMINQLGRDLRRTTGEIARLTAENQYMRDALVAIRDSDNPWNEIADDTLARLDGKTDASEVQP